MRSLIFLFTFSLIFTPALHASRTTTTPRDFNAGYSPQDKKDIRHIILTLNASNPVMVLPHVSGLNHAGDRIGPVHPLPFLECIFIDEELKVGIHNLKRQNGKFWREFMGGLSGSLTEERNRGNLTDEMVVIFAERVGIDVNLIQPLVAGYRWYDFVNTLSTKIPRKGDYGRYNM